MVSVLNKIPVLSCTLVQRKKYCKIDYNNAYLLEFSHTNCFVVKQPIATLIEETMTFYPVILTLSWEHNNYKKANNQ